MHSEFRRLPAERHERAWHAKRLADVTTASSTTQTPSASTPKSTTTTTNTTPTIASATTSTSQVKTSSAVVSPTPLSSSSSQTLTSSASLLTSSLTTPSTTPSSTHSPTVTGLSSSLPNTSQSVALTTASPSPTTQSASTSSSTKLSGGALGGIIAGSVIISLALLIFIVRKTYLRRRQARRVSWPDGDVFNEAKPLPSPPVEDFSEKPASVRNAPVSPFDTFGQQIYPRPSQPPIQNTQSPFTGYAAPALPNPSYNNPMPTYSRYPTVNPRNPDAIVSMARAAAGASSYATPAPKLRTGEEAFVNRVFIPSLPDELSVTGGERIRVLAVYDDGWTLCANGRGEQGMVPQECIDQRVASDEGDTRNAGRSSSLNADGRRY
ncbi:hypothetical protein AZE42_04136 [Rhizopogon vesiculosus]|uniref:SH3 domain-containing protein n=1 Tax=Rhizopogon vesiculosus TaxID=180088 RepID=A0A1J8R6C7_9AGAM|nr:hypothetical protein AZE42_04136 [Rhizopogon vesiculosus]